MVDVVTEEMSNCAVSRPRKFSIAVRKEIEK
jgi:hypothetical protein